MAKNILVKVVVWSVVASLFLGVMFLVNRKVFQVPYTSLQKGQQNMEFPLSKVTVSIKKKVMLDAFDKCTWAAVKEGTHGLMLYPREGKEVEFVKYVNENGHAAKISELYHNWEGQEHGFIWDEDLLQFFMPEYKSNKVILVPTWILFKLSQDKAL